MQTRAPKLLVAQKGRVVGCVFMHDLNDGTRVLVAKQTKKEGRGGGGGRGNTSMTKNDRGGVGT